ncbi:hypothetical protein HUA78_12265 [Myxococcus sp. CA033]|uniref:hypothetical protein n=1 Tax=Myxococcus sp. CA033 TaxID=2741516 RepID=UPI00157B48E7|nr:hypothetical protein [Myxococcus sp. CA033]NTX35221.1 hypothetical protein [Myxococcus sp. CA033]
MSAAAPGRFVQRLSVVVACLTWVACNPVDPTGSSEALGESSQALPYCQCPLQYLRPGEVVDPLQPQCPYYECENSCGDGYCGPLEDSWSCSWDCGAPTVCGNGTCDFGESEGTCPADCYCGDGWCNGESVYSCPVDCGCPNPCGNGTCGAGESTATCPGDCGSACGDGACNGTESVYSCAADCGYCGDGYCAGSETRYSCSQDCGYSYPCLLPVEQCPLQPLTPDAPR